jgi:hypothetical protein
MITSEVSSSVPQTASGGRRPPRRLLLGMMVAVFFSGGVIGSGSTLMLINRRITDNEKHHDPAKTSQRIISELTEKLSLSETQTAQVEQITKDHLAALDRLRREVFFKMIRDEFKQMEDQVSAVLDDEQRAKYHAWLDEKRQRLCPPGARHGHVGYRPRASRGPSSGDAKGQRGKARQGETSAPQGETSVPPGEPSGGESSQAKE